MKKTIFIIFLLVIFLSACVSAQPDIHTQNTAMAIAQTSIVQTKTALPTITSIFTPTAPVIVPTYSPYPTQTPIFIITPNAIQVKRWKEYQNELAKLVLSHPGGEYLFYESALCEWDILGYEDEKLFVWAECAYDIWGRGPAVIFLETNGSIKDVEYAFSGYGRNTVIEDLFPPEIQVKIYSYFSSARSQEMIEHIKYRFSYPDEPPLIVLLNPLIP